MPIHHTSKESRTVSTTSASPSNDRKAGGVSPVMFCTLQVVFLAATLGYGAHRYREMTADRVLPTPAETPISIGPLYDRPAVVSDEQLGLVLERLQPRLRGPQPRINQVDHALRFWGVPATFEDPECLSGVELRELLLDHRSFVQAWGSDTKPFLIPDTRADQDLLSFRTKDGLQTASHVDHTIAGLGEVGTPLDYPVITPIGERPLRAALIQSLREFSLNQEEYEWSTLAYLHYLPHVASWYTTEGQQITWDRLADRLMRQRLAQGVCFGNHRLHALVMMLRVDAEYNRLLSDEARARVLAYLRDATDRLIATQHEDGYWDAGWPGVELEGQAPSVEGPLGTAADRMLATGHALEWWSLAPEEVLPPDDVIVRAGQWISNQILALSDAEIRRYYTFLTHAGRALALWRGKFPYEVALPAHSDDPALTRSTAIDPAPVRRTSTSVGQ